jgi:hypothetical protein
MVAQATIATNRSAQKQSLELDHKLDCALMDTFPASDPVSLIQPAPHEPEMPTPAGRDGDASEARRYATLPHFALHPPVYLRDREPVRSLDEAAETVHRYLRGWSDARSEGVLARLVEAATPEEAEEAGRLFRTWAKEWGILIVPPEDH